MMPCRQRHVISLMPLRRCFATLFAPLLLMMMLIRHADAITIIAAAAALMPLFRRQIFAAAAADNALRHAVLIYAYLRRRC